MKPLIYKAATAFPGLPYNLYNITQYYIYIYVYGDMGARWVQATMCIDGLACFVVGGQISRKEKSSHYAGVGKGTP